MKKRNVIQRILYEIKKWCYCSIFHKYHRCYPEVWKVEMGSWHCSLCHPCNEWFVKWEKEQEKLRKKELEKLAKTQGEMYGKSLFRKE